MHGRNSRLDHESKMLLVIMADDNVLTPPSFDLFCLFLVRLVSDTRIKYERFIALEHSYELSIVI